MFLSGEVISYTCALEGERLKIKNAIIKNFKVIFIVVRFSRLESGSDIQSKDQHIVDLGIVSLPSVEFFFELFLLFT